MLHTGAWCLVGASEWQLKLQWDQYHGGVPTKCWEYTLFMVCSILSHGKKILISRSLFSVKCCMLKLAHCRLGTWNNVRYARGKSGERFLKESYVGSLLIKATKKSEKKKQIANPKVWIETCQARACEGESGGQRGAVESSWKTVKRASSAVESELEKFKSMER